jgi:hypothetical protein
MLGYAIGRFLFAAVGAPLIDFYQGWETFTSLRSGFAAHGFLWIFGAALTPIPFKVFTIAAGAAEIRISVLLGASLIGRGARFFAVGGLFRLFGPPIKKFIDRYFNLLTVIFLALLVLGFVFVKILWNPPKDRNEPREKIDKEEPRGLIPESGPAKIRKAQSSDPQKPLSGGARRFGRPVRSAPGLPRRPASIKLGQNPNPRGSREKHVIPRKSMQTDGYRPQHG